MAPWMSDKDIADMYLTAANRRKQIQILAELNLCKKEKIIEILIARGIEVPIGPRVQRKKTSKKYWSVKDVVELLKLAESGMSRRKLALHFGCTEIAVRNVLVKCNPDVVSLPPKNIAIGRERYRKERELRSARCNRSDFNNRLNINMDPDTRGGLIDGEKQKI